MKNININKWIYLIGGLWLIILLSNLIFPISYDDDFWYSKIGNPFVLQMHEYSILKWHGRYLTHTLQRIILQLGFPITDMIQSIFTIILALLMYFHVNPYFLKSQEKKDCMLFVVLGIFAL